MSQVQARRLAALERAAGLTRWDAYKDTPLATWPEAVQAEWLVAMMNGDAGTSEALTATDLDEHIAMLRELVATASSPL